MVIPGRVPGVKSSDPRIRLLPAADNKTRLWKSYQEHYNRLHEETGESKYNLIKLFTIIAYHSTACTLQLVCGCMPLSIIHRLA